MGIPGTIQGVCFPAALFTEIGSLSHSQFSDEFPSESEVYSMGWELGRRASDVFVRPSHQGSLHLENRALWNPLLPQYLEWSVATFHKQVRFSWVLPMKVTFPASANDFYFLAPFIQTSGHRGWQALITLDLSLPTLKSKNDK